jgi:hypothetical protein
MFFHVPFRFQSLPYNSPTWGEYMGFSPADGSHAHNISRRPWAHIVALQEPTNGQSRTIGNSASSLLTAALRHLETPSASRTRDAKGGLNVIKLAEGKLEDASSDLTGRRPA